MSSTKMRKPVYNVPAKAPDADPYAERGRIFGQRLSALMLAKGWNQSDLSRQASLHMTDGQEINRQRVSSYISKGHLPNNIALHAIAKALGVQPEDLVPVDQAHFVNTPFSMTSNGVQARVKLDLTVSLEDAIAIAAIAKKYAQ